MSYVDKLTFVLGAFSVSFKGGVYGNEGDVAMTAFVLSTLAECKCNGVVCV